MKCSFCNREIEKGTGKLYSLKDGERFYFCSSKCEKNQLKLKRKARKLKWVTKSKKKKEEKK
ncbi:MAG: 50S ribosomal protein L24e [archaeon]